MHAILNTRRGLGVLLATVALVAASAASPAFATEHLDADRSGADQRGTDGTAGSTEQVLLEGTYEVIHADVVSGSVSAGAAEVAVLVGDDGSIHRLEGVGQDVVKSGSNEGAKSTADVSALPVAGSRVRVHGGRDGSGGPLDVDAIEVIDGGSGDGRTNEPDPPTIEPKSMLVLRVHGTDQSPYAPWDENRVHHEFDRLRDWYEAVSDGDLVFTLAPVPEWLEIPLDSSEFGCGGEVFDTVGSAAVDAAAAAGFDPDDYDYTSVFFRNGPSCDWGGGVASYSVPLNVNNIFRIDPWVHEVGHNLGLGHSNGWDCGEESFGGGGGVSGCSHVEYGNRYSEMGQTWPEALHFSSDHLRQLDWMGDAQLDVDADGIYTVTPMGEHGGIRTLHVDTTVASYDIEYRRAVGVDSPWPSGTTRGVVVLRNGYLIDATPDSRPGAMNDMADAALRKGYEVAQTPKVGLAGRPGAGGDSPLRLNLPDWPDELTTPEGLRIELLSTTAGQATVRITGTDSFVQGVGAELHQGGSLVSWQLAGTWNEPDAPVLVESLPDGPSVTVGPGDDSALLPPPAEEGCYTFRVTLLDGSGSSLESEDEVCYSHMPSASASFSLAPDLGTSTVDVNVWNPGGIGITAGGSFEVSTQPGGPAGSTDVPSTHVEVAAEWTGCRTFSVRFEAADGTQADIAPAGANEVCILDHLPPDTTYTVQLFGQEDPGVGVDWFALVSLQLPAQVYLTADVTAEVSSLPGSIEASFPAMQGSTMLPVDWVGCEDFTVSAPGPGGTPFDLDAASDTTICRHDSPVAGGTFGATWQDPGTAFVFWVHSPDVYADGAIESVTFSVDGHGDYVAFPFSQTFPSWIAQVSLGEIAPQSEMAVDVVAEGQAGSGTVAEGVLVAPVVHPEIVIEEGDATHTVAPVVSTTDSDGGPLSDFYYDSIVPLTVPPAWEFPDGCEVASPWEDFEPPGFMEPIPGPASSHPAAFEMLGDTVAEPDECLLVRTWRLGVFVGEDTAFTPIRILDDDQ